MSDYPHPEPGDLDLDSPFTLPEPAVVHLRGAGHEPADERIAEAILTVRPGLLFVAAQVS